MSTEVNDPMTDSIDPGWHSFCILEEILETFSGSDFSNSQDFRHLFLGHGLKDS